MKNNFHEAGMSPMSGIDHLVTGHRSAQNLLPPIRSIKDGIRQTPTKSHLAASLRINDNLLKVSIVDLSRLKCTLLPFPVFGEIVALSFNSSLSRSSRTVGMP
ncbi:MAG: hypothetical protein JRE23_13090 [Deltaproteobacteria bacterium]|nr:hypothetical protein [Deltaproteobacteria bacterium]